MTKNIFKTLGILLITFLILSASYVVNLFLMKPLSMDHYLAKELVIELIDSPEAMEYMKTITGMSDTEVRVEIERYIVWPGQALSYKVGMIKILELRDKAKTLLGDKFNIKDFHSAVLDHGNPPLFVVEKMVNKMIEEAKF